MRILLTNDDGFGAAGLSAALDALVGHEVYVAAPTEQMSAVSARLTIREPVVCRAASLPGAAGAWEVEGTPVDCVKLALAELLPAPPDLVVSGFNHGPNVGQDVFYSGTVAAALEAVMFGYAALAVSLASEKALDTARRALPALTRVAVEWEAAGRMALNANVPAEDDPPVVVVRHGNARYEYGYRREGEEGGRTLYRIYGRHEADPSPDTDSSALALGCLALTPLIPSFDAFPADRRAAVADLARLVALHFPVLR